MNDLLVFINYPYFKIGIKFLSQRKQLLKHSISFFTCEFALQISFQ